MKGKKAMRKAIILLLICAVAAAVSGCAKGNVTGDGGDQTEEYRFAGYYNWNQKLNFSVQGYYKGTNNLLVYMDRYSLLT